MQPVHFSEHTNQNAIHSRMLGKNELEQGKMNYMNSTYTQHFTTFRKLPKFHHTAARVIKCMETEGLTVQGAVNRLQLISLDKTEKMLVSCADGYRNIIDFLIEKIKLLEDNPFFDIYKLKVVLGELLWGNQSLPLGTIETTNLLYYEYDVKEAFVEADTVLQKTYVSKLPTYVRVNTLSISLEQCINAFCKEGWNLVTYTNSYSDYLTTISQLKEKEFVRDFHISELLAFPPATSFYNHPGYLKGKFVLQDKGSCLASFLLNPKPGSVVLDMCAAPGKTTNHLANIINNEGIVYAVENHPHRYNKLYSFLELTNVRCAETMWLDNTKVKIDNLNYILIDASSTYTGIFYKRPRPGVGRRLKQYSHVAVRTLVYALLNFTNAKRIVYSSCTIHPEEGEKVVQEALARTHDSYNLLDVKELLWNEWFSTGHTVTDSGTFPNVNKCLRINPDTDKSFGYFIAVFERNFDVPVPPYKWRASKGPPNYEEINEDKNIDNNRKIPKPAATPFVKKFKKKKFYPAKNKKKNKPYPILPNNPQTSTSANQSSYPGSRPFYEIEHNQSYS